MEETANYTRSNKMTSTLGLTIFIVAIVFSVLGYLIGSAQPAKKDNFSPLTSTKVGQSSIIQSQTATAMGLVTKNDGGMVTVQASQGGETQTFKLNPQLSVYQSPASSSGKLQTSNNPADIKLNTFAILGLKWIGAAYEVTSVTYLQPPSPPKKQ